MAGHVRWARNLDKLTYGVVLSEGLVLEAGADACGETTAHLHAVYLRTGTQVWSVDDKKPGLLGQPGFAIGEGVVAVSEAPRSSASG